MSEPTAPARGQLSPMSTLLSSSSRGPKPSNGVQHTLQKMDSPRLQALKDQITRNFDPVNLIGHPQRELNGRLSLVHRLSKEKKHFKKSLLPLLVQCGYQPPSRYQNSTRLEDANSPLTPSSAGAGCHTTNAAPRNLPQKRINVQKPAGPVREYVHHTLETFRDKFPVPFPENNSYQHFTMQDVMSKDVDAELLEAKSKRFNPVAAFPHFTMLTALARKPHIPDVVKIASMIERWLDQEPGLSSYIWTMWESHKPVGFPSARETWGTRFCKWPGDGEAASKATDSPDLPNISTNRTGCTSMGPPPKPTHTAHPPKLGSMGPPPLPPHVRQHGTKRKFSDTHNHHGRTNLDKPNKKTRLDPVTPSAQGQKSHSGPVGRPSPKLGSLSPQSQGSHSLNKENSSSESRSTFSDTRGSWMKGSVQRESQGTSDPTVMSSYELQRSDPTSLPPSNRPVQAAIRPELEPPQTDMSQSEDLNIDPSATEDDTKATEDLFSSSLPLDHDPEDFSQYDQSLFGLPDDTGNDASPEVGAEDDTDIAWDSFLKDETSSAGGLGPSIAEAVEPTSTSVDQDGLDTSVEPRPAEGGGQEKDDSSGPIKWDYDALAEELGLPSGD